MRSAMKKLIIAAWILLALLFVTVPMLATPTLLMGTLVTVDTTTSNSPAIAAFTYNQPLQQFTVSHGALTSTGAFYLTIQATLDQTNYVTLGTWHPTTTNAATEVFSGASYAPTNYMRVQCTSTNSVQVGGSYGI
jgi:hypothetical protein